MYKFHLQKNVHMYNHVLTYKDCVGEIETIIEDSPNSGEGILVWEMDWCDDPERRELISRRFQDWAKVEGLNITMVTTHKRC